MGESGSASDRLLLDDAREPVRRFEGVRVLARLLGRDVLVLSPSESDALEESGER